MKKWFRRITPEREALLGHSWLRPIADRLTLPQIWHFNRRSVARGVALGFFVGFFVPIGQIILIALFAGTARGNLLVAAVATLVTNPLTVPPIYYAAYRTGAFVLGRTEGGATPFLSADGLDPHALLDMAANASGPILLGLFNFAVVSAIVGFALVHLAWRVSLHWQWRRRAHRNGGATGSGTMLRS
ncbi:MAG: DUF2062 domain-containing protein [Novosphingobium sp.]